MAEMRLRDEIRVSWQQAHQSSVTKEELQAMLDRTRGLWADWDEDVEGLLDDARQKWDIIPPKTAAK